MAELKASLVRPGMPGGTHGRRLAAIGSNFQGLRYALLQVNLRDGRYRSVTPEEG